MQLYEIARELNKKYKPNERSEPYLRLMESASSLDDKVGFLTGKEIVESFLRTCGTVNSDILPIIEELKSKLLFHKTK